MKFFQEKLSVLPQNIKGGRNVELNTKVCVMTPFIFSSFLPSGLKIIFKRITTVHIAAYQTYFKPFDPLG